VSNFWSTVMVDSGPFPSTPGEEAFIEAILSEEALAEVSLAIGMIHWSPAASDRERAVAHSSRASNVLVQRIKSGKAHTTAVMAAVMSMAIGARLAQEEVAWNIHIDGLASIIAERRAQGAMDSPGLLCDFLIM